MAVELAAVYVPIIPSLKGAPAEIQKQLGLTDTSKVGTKIGSRLGGFIGSGLKSTATSTVAVAAAGIGTALVKGFSRLNALDQANQKLTGLGHSAQAVDQIMSNALASVKGTAFGMDAAATVAASAVAAGIKPGKDLERTLALVADAATIAGVDMGSMGAIFNKVAASNKVQMDVINQLHDAGVPALASLADYMGVTAEEASKMASSGAIDFATFQAAMEQSLGGAAQSSGSTFSGAMANVMASLGRIGAGILSGVFPKLAPLFQSLTTALGPLEDKAAEIGAVIGDKVAPVLDWLSNALSGGLGQLKVAPQILGPAAAAFVALGSSGLAPLLGMVPGLGGLASKLAFLGGPVGIATAAFAGMVAVSPNLQAALGDLLGALGTAATALAPSLSLIATILADSLVSAIQAAEPVLTAIASALSWLLTDVVAPNAGVLTVLAIGIGTVVAAVNLWKIATSAWTAITYGAAGASYAAGTAAKIYTIAMNAQAMAMKVAAVATRAFNLVMAANPIMLVVTAIAALVAGLVWFFTQTEIGREIWANFTAAIGAAATWLWETILQPVFTAIGAIFTWIYENIILPVVTGIMIYIGLWAALVTWLWESVIQPIFAGIGQVFTWIYENIIKPIVDLIVRSIQTWAAIFTWLYENIVKPVFDSISNAFKWIWSNAVEPVVGWITEKLQLLGVGFRILYESFIRPAFENIKSTLNSVWTWINQHIFTPFKNGVDLIGQAFRAAFSGLGSFVHDAFAGVLSAVRGPVNGVIGLINGAIRGLNGLRVTIPDWVPIVGGQTWGINLPTIPHLAAGATVLPRHGGTLAVLAEAGRAESVVDTGLVNRALEEGLAGNDPAGPAVQGPLIHIDHLTVDSEQRVDQVAQALWDRAERASRASGRVNLGGAVTV